MKGVKQPTSTTTRNDRRGRIVGLYFCYKCKQMGGTLRKAPVWDAQGRQMYVHKECK